MRVAPAHTYRNLVVIEELGSVVEHPVLRVQVDRERRR